MNGNKLSNITQKDNTAGGNIVGGDYTQSTHIYQNNHSIAPSSRLILLLAKLRGDIEADNQTEHLIAELKRYQEPKSKTTKTLEVKLQEGNKEHLIEYAIETKEIFTKKLTKYSLFESSQDIHALILARIHSLFSTKIKPLIHKGADESFIEDAICNQIISPIVADLSVEPLRYYDLEVYGMLYFLTGNCHIDWA